MFKKIIHSSLLKLNPETAHNLTLNLLKKFDNLGLLKAKVISNPVSVMGLSFPNPIGLAAGCDKDGVCIDAWFKLGFGFVEVGTVTPKPQSGNPHPRLFRLREHHAVINRMGFNNKGVDHLVQQLRARKSKGVVGVNIGKNKNTPLEKALGDYEYCLNKVAPYADFVTLNISSPNTPELRQLQTDKYLRGLLKSILKTRDVLAEQLGKKIPICVKVAPDLTDDDIKAMARTFLYCKVDGVIATNTTVDKSSVSRHIHGDQAGGLSGRPLFNKSTEVLAKFHEALEGKIPLIGVGGVDSKRTFNAKLSAGADLVQVYTGLIYGFDISKNLPNKKP